MSDMTLTGGRIHAGYWEAELAAPGGNPPGIEIRHQGRALDGVNVVAASTDGSWSVSVPIPVELLSDGVQTFLVTETATGTQLGKFTIVTGQPLEDDIRAEVDLLRAELDLLKKAFRRHCRETE